MRNRHRRPTPFIQQLTNFTCQFHRKLLSFLSAPEPRLIYWVASAGEQPALAWDFVRANFDTLSARHGPPFRDTFVAGLMTNFTDRAHAAELAGFAPAHQSVWAIDRSQTPFIKKRMSTRLEPTPFFPNSAISSGKSTP